MESHFSPAKKGKKEGKRNDIGNALLCAVVVVPALTSLLRIRSSSRELVASMFSRESSFDIGRLPMFSFDRMSTTFEVNTPKSTKIIGFSDFGYKEYAWKWYQEMENLGYNEHIVVAQDRIAASYFEEKGMRYDLVYPSSNLSLKEECQLNPSKRVQRYRRMLFGSRWNYVLRQLKAGYPILMTDVDNVYTRHVPMSELEESEYDVFHAYAGVFNSFPLTIFRQVGFTVCGGMSWLRPVPGVVEFVKTLVERCNCEVLQCNCRCDDQVIINHLISANDSPYKYKWDTPMKVPKSEEEATWDGRTGTCTRTGHRVKIWDRHTAFRRHLDPAVCPDPAKSWIAMPSNVDRVRLWEQWREACPSNSSNSILSSR